MTANLMISRLKRHFLSKNDGIQLRVPDLGTQAYAAWAAAVSEVESLRAMCLKVSQGQVQETLERQFPAAQAARLNSSMLAQDLRTFAEGFLPLSEPEQLIQDAQLIDAAGANPRFYVGPDVAWFLSVSRCLGLVSLASLVKLRSTKIRVLGASVAASTVELLASLGAEDISCADAGLIDPTNVPRLPMADLFNIGTLKSQALVEHLQRRNPYGKFIALEENLTPESVHAFLADADLIIEVIDDIPMKSYVQTVALSRKPGTPLLFIADLGNQPLVKVVRADEQGYVERPFGRKWSVSERKILMDVQHDSRLIPQAAQLMVKESLPPEHALQLQFNVLGIMPFWSQTPIASRMSAAMAAISVLNILNETTSSPGTVDVPVS